MKHELQFADVYLVFYMPKWIVFLWGFLFYNTAFMYAVLRYMVIEDLLEMQGNNLIQSEHEIALSNISLKAYTKMKSYLDEIVITF